MFPRSVVRNSVPPAPEPAQPSSSQREQSGTALSHPLVEDRNAFAVPFCFQEAGHSPSQLSRLLHPRHPDVRHALI